MKDENEVKEKQEFLRIHILEKGYDADEFMEFLETLKGEKGLKIENWSKNDLIQAVEQFTKMNPRQEIIQINNNTNIYGEKANLIYESGRRIYVDGRLYTTAGDSLIGIYTNIHFLKNKRIEFLCPIHGKVESASCTFLEKGCRKCNKKIYKGRIYRIY